MKKIVYAVSTTAVLIHGITSLAEEPSEESESYKYISDKFIERLYFKGEGSRRGYFSKININSTSVRPKTDGVFGLALGYQFLNWPMNLEFSFYDHDIAARAGSAELDAESHMYMAHAFINFPFSDSLIKEKPFLGKIVPYITFGIGRADNINVRFYPYGSTTGDPAKSAVVVNLSRKREPVLDAGFGVRVRLSKRWSADAAWKYMMLGKLSIPNGSSSKSVNVNGYQASLGLILHFI